MKLLKFPLLVHDEIFSRIKLSELVRFSFVSEDIKQSIKMSQMKRFEGVRFIHYDCFYEERIFVDFSSIEGGKEQLLTLEEREDTDNKYNNNYDDHNKYYQWNVSGRTIDFQLNDRFSSPLIASFHPWDRASMINCVHNHFLDLFGNSVEYQWIAYGYKTPIPQLQNLSACINHLHIASKFGNMETLENFFSSISALKYVGLLICTEREVFGPESIFYQAESIKCHRTYASPDVLRYFQGSQAVVRCRKCDISDLIEFVNRWKSGEAFRKLEYLKIEDNTEFFPEYQVLDGIEAKYIDPTRKPPKHILPKVYIHGLDDEPNTDPITSHTYVVRESDGHVASVMIHYNKFRFGVWNMTEDEFLRSVE